MFRDRKWRLVEYCKVDLWDENYEEVLSTAISKYRKNREIIFDSVIIVLHRFYIHCLLQEVTYWLFISSFKKVQFELLHLINASVNSSCAQCPFQATAGHLPALSVPGVGHLQILCRPGPGRLPTLGPFPSKKSLVNKNCHKKQHSFWCSECWILHFLTFLGSCKSQEIKRAVQKFHKRKEREPALKLQAPGHPHTLTRKHSKW